MKTKKQIIEETVDFYSADPKGRRSIYGGSCLYLSTSGCKCAVGRYLRTDIEIKGLRLPSVSIDSLCDYNNVNHIDSLLIEEVRGHGYEFWNDLQQLHDYDGYWDNNKISYEGRKYAHELLKRYANK